MLTMRSRATVAVLAAAVTGMTLGLSAAPAHATIGSLTAKLIVADHVVGDPRPQPDRGGRVCQVWLLQQVSYPCYVHLEGTLSTGSPVEAEQLASSGHRIVMRLWGDDPFYDDFLYGPQTFSFDVNPCCATRWTTFKWGRWINSRELDEDNWPDGDEVYAGIRLVDSRGRTIRSVESNRLKLNIGLPGAPGPLP